jgi:hypothetical protein
VRATVPLLSVAFAHISSAVHFEFVDQVSMEDGQGTKSGDGATFVPLCSVS